LWLHRLTDPYPIVDDGAPLQQQPSEEIQSPVLNFPARDIPTIGVPFTPPDRYGKCTSISGTRWEIEIENPAMQARAEFVMSLDPMLPPEDVAGHVCAKFGNFLCRIDGQPMVFNGQNGGGTPKLLCKHCNTSPSIWNTFELTLWKYKKVITATMLSNYGLSVDLCGEIFGVGKGALNEVRMSLPCVEYSRTGELETIEYTGEKFAVIYQDMVYKGQKGMMLGICGGLNITALGDEKTGEGLDEFYDSIEEHVDAERYIFVMDMRINVIKKILERFNERAIVVAQNHTLWGDVCVYFYYCDEWYTLRLRTDAFSEPSQKRDEDKLLAVGEIELYRGLKGVSPRMSLEDITEASLRKKVDELLNQIRNTDWSHNGRIDLVMRAKVQKLNALLKELKWRGCDLSDSFGAIKSILGSLIDKYASTINRTIKKKIVNAWRVLRILKAEVNLMSERLLKESLPEKKKRTGQNDSSKKKKKSWVKFFANPELIYRGKLEGANVPESGQWILALLRELFSGKEITNNMCEGRFGVIGRKLRQGRSIYMDRAVTKVHLQAQGVLGNLEWLIENYPLQDLGKRGQRRTRTHLLVGGRYQITYVNRHKERSERVVDVRGRKKRGIIAYCHTKKMDLTFNRRRMESITLLHPPSS